MSNVKRFHGWRPLISGERLLATDKFVLLVTNYWIDENRALTPEDGEAVGRYVGQVADEWVDAAVKYWMPYRKCSDPSIPRRIVMHNSFSKPLPLP